jgi:hypothetical protein
MHYGDEGGVVDEAVLAERLQRQHKLMCAAIQAGRLEDLKKMTSKNGAARKAGAAKGQKNKKKALADPGAATADHAENGHNELPELELDLSGLDIPIPKPDLFQPPPKKMTVIDNVSILDDGSVVALEGVEVVSALAGASRPEHDNLCIEFVGDSSFRSGDRKTIWLLVSRGSRREVIRGAEVMIKILGTRFRPIVSHSATDKNGLVSAHLTVPNFDSGRAIVAVRVKNDGEEVEVVRPITNG